MGMPYCPDCLAVLDGAETVLPEDKPDPRDALVKAVRGFLKRKPKAAPELRKALRKLDSQA